jgi:hypothetical protein
MSWLIRIIEKKEVQFLLLLIFFLKKKNPKLDFH